MLKYKVSSADMKYMFESEEELTFDQAVAYALDEDQPETLGTLISVKTYGKGPTKHAITVDVLRKLDRLQNEDEADDRDAAQERA